jgi:hypothetical protein
MGEGMKVAVVYESMFGNTRAIAEAIGEGISGALSGAGAFEVAVLPVAEADAGALDVDLLVVGGPTHMRRMTSTRTREMRARSGAKSPGSWTTDKQHWEHAVAMGVREWLTSLPRAVDGGGYAAAFDTRLSYMPAVGAGPQIVLGLRSRGYRVEDRPRCFFVESPQGPLRPGEHDRAVAWGTALALRLSQRALS